VFKPPYYISKLPSVQSLRHPGTIFMRRAWQIAAHVVCWQILLQKSKVASVRIFGEFFGCNATDDSYNFSRAAEIACEFSVR
jgi:hypothetical protein